MEIDQALEQFYVELRSRLQDAQFIDNYDDETVESWRRVGLNPELKLPRLQLTDPDPARNSWRTCVAFDDQPVDHWFTESQAIFVANVEWGSIETDCLSFLPSLGNTVSGEEGLLGVFTALLSTSDLATSGIRASGRTGHFIAIDGHPIWESTAHRLRREVNIPLNYDETFLSDPDVIRDRYAGLAACLPADLKSPFFLRIGSAISASLGWLSLVYGLKFVVDHWQEINHVLANADLPGFLYSDGSLSKGHQRSAIDGRLHPSEAEDVSRPGQVKVDSLIGRVKGPDVSENGPSETFIAAMQHQEGSVSSLDMSQFIEISLLEEGALTPEEKCAEVFVQDLGLQHGVYRVYGSTWSSFDTDGEVIDEAHEDESCHSLVLISEAVNGLNFSSMNSGTAWLGRRPVVESNPVDPTTAECWGGRYIVGHDLDPGRYILSPKGSNKTYFRILDQNLEELSHPATYTPPGESRLIDIDPGVFAIEFKGRLRRSE